MSFESLLNERCTIQKASYGAQGDDGQQVITYSDTSNVRCRLVPGGGKEFRVEKQNVVAEYLLYLQGNAVITETSRVIVGTRTYDVRLVRNPSNMGHHLECVLEAVK